LRSTLVKNWGTSNPVPPTGLDFPSGLTSSGDPYIAFQFLNPQNDGLPFAGPGNQGCTYIWKYRPRQQTGYYSQFWWSQNDGHFTHDYYGPPPYPDPPPTGTAHNWEISAERGDDQITEAGDEHDVVYDVWHTQAFRVVHNGNNTVTLRFWITLPSNAPHDIIEDITDVGYGDVTPPSPALTWGDNPWFPDFGHERLSGIVRGIKIFNIALSDQDIFDEAASESLVTANGIANIWYMKINPTPDNMLCEAGTGRTPTWASATKPTLWQGP
jgi:hypothetical protein